MLSHTRLLLAAVVASSMLVACGDNEATSTETIPAASTPAATDDAPAVTAPTAAATAPVNDSKVEVGMTEQAVADLLGEKSFSQTRTLDALTITHTEWTNVEGTTSVQFQNGKAVFSQFVAAK
jgi:outer membrane murein-binding lipoprotein Lpp